MCVEMTSSVAEPGLSVSEEIFLLSSAGSHPIGDFLPSLVRHLHLREGLHQERANIDENSRLLSPELLFPQSKLQWLLDQPAISLPTTLSGSQGGFSLTQKGDHGAV